MDKIFSAIKTCIQSQDFTHNPTKIIKKTLNDVGKSLKESPLTIQALIIVVIDDICLSASIGAIRALMSALVGSKLYCLNTEHTIPGNEIEERRVCHIMAKLKNTHKGDQASFKAALSLYIT
jgi:hypothetical protein